MGQVVAWFDPNSKGESRWKMAEWEVVRLMSFTTKGPVKMQSCETVVSILLLASHHPLILSRPFGCVSRYSVGIELFSGFVQWRVNTNRNRIQRKAAMSNGVALINGFMQVSTVRSTLMLVSFTCQYLFYVALAHALRTALTLYSLCTVLQYCTFTTGRHALIILSEPRAQYCYGIGGVFNSLYC